MKTVKWILITILLMVIAYAVISAITSFLWAIYIGTIAAGVVCVVIAYYRLKKLFNDKDKV